MAEFNGLQYLLVEVDRSFNVFEQGNDYSRLIRKTTLEKSNSGWATSIHYPTEGDRNKTRVSIGLTIEESLTKAYASLLEEFNGEHLIDKTLRAQPGSVEADLAEDRSR